MGGQADPMIDTNRIQCMFGKSTAYILQCFRIPFEQGNQQRIDMYSRDIPFPLTLDNYEFYQKYYSCIIVAKFNFILKGILVQFHDYLLFI